MIGKMELEDRVSHILRQSNRFLIDMKIKSVCLTFNPISPDEIIRYLKDMPVWIASDHIDDEGLKIIRYKVSDNNLTKIIKRNGESAYNLFIRSLYDIDEHHGELSSTSHYNKLIIIGYDGDIPIDIIRELRFISIDILPNEILLKK